MEDVEELDIDLSMRGFFELLKAYWHPKRIGLIYKKTGPFSWEEPYGKNSVRALYLGQPTRASRDSRKCKIFEHIYWHPRFRVLFPGRSQHVMTLHVTRIDDERVNVQVACNDLRIKDTMFKHFVTELYKLRERYARERLGNVQTPWVPVDGKPLRQLQDIAPVQDSLSMLERAALDETLDGFDLKIVETVVGQRRRGLPTTDDRIAMLVPPNSKTGLPHNRVTINRRRCKLRDKGYNV